jgi:hypothetical protein
MPHLMKQLFSHIRLRIFLFQHEKWRKKIFGPYPSIETAAIFE